MVSSVSLSQCSLLSSCKNGLYKSLAFARNQICTFKSSFDLRSSAIEVWHGATKGGLIVVTAAAAVNYPTIVITAVSGGVVYGAMYLRYLNATRFYPSKILGNSADCCISDVIDVTSSALSALAASFVEGKVAKFVVGSIVGTITSRAAQFVCQKLMPEYEAVKKNEMVKTGVLSGVAATLTAKLELSNSAPSEVTSELLKVVISSMVAGASAQGIFR